MVVDDEPDAADSMCQLLLIVGNAARAVYSGAAAVALAGTFAPDVVGVWVAVRDFDRDGTPDVACAAGPGLAGSPVRVFDGRTGSPAADLPGIPDFAGGTFVDAR